jgi:hypothetical protein
MRTTGKPDLETREKFVDMYDVAGAVGNSERGGEKIRRRRAPRRALPWVTLAMVVAVVSTSAEAGVIAGTAAVGGGTFTGGPVTLVPNNDNSVPPSPNLFDVSSSAIFSDPFDIVMQIMDSGGTTEYFFTQSLTNGTGFAWGGVILSLGSGSGASFLINPGDDGLDFDTPDRDPTPFSSAFLVNTHDPDQLIFFGGGQLNPGETTTLSYSVDIPDSPTIDPGAWIPGGYEGTMRFSVIPIPEPSTGLLVGLGLVVLSGRWRKVGTRSLSD